MSTDYLIGWAMDLRDEVNSKINSTDFRNLGSNARGKIINIRDCFTAFIDLHTPKKSVEKKKSFPIPAAPLTYYPSPPPPIYPQPTPDPPTSYPLCNNCHLLLPDTAAPCYNCGTSPAETQVKECRSCMATFPASQNNCDNCGAYNPNKEDRSFGPKPIRSIILDEPLADVFGRALRKGLGGRLISNDSARPTLPPIPSMTTQERIDKKAKRQKRKEERRKLQQEKDKLIGKTVIYGMPLPSFDDLQDKWTNKVKIVPPMTPDQWEKIDKIVDDYKIPFDDRKKMVDGFAKAAEEAAKLNMPIEITHTEPPSSIIKKIENEEIRHTQEEKTIEEIQNIAYVEADLGITAPKTNIVRRVANKIGKPVNEIPMGPFYDEKDDSELNDWRELQHGPV